MTEPIKATRPSPDLPLFVMKFEGFSPKAYQCEAGKWTIGYGETENVKPGDTIKEPLARENLEIKLHRLSEKILKLVKVPLSQRQLDSLCSFVYNIGTGAFSNSDLLRLLNLGCYETVPHQILRWKYVTHPEGYKIISKGLFHRRIKEASLWASDSAQGYLDLANKPVPLE